MLGPLAPNIGARTVRAHADSLVVLEITGLGEGGHTTSEDRWRAVYRTRRLHVGLAVAVTCGRTVGAPAGRRWPTATRGRRRLHARLLLHYRTRGTRASDSRARDGFVVRVHRLGGLNRHLGLRALQARKTLEATLAMGIGAVCVVGFGVRIDFGGNFR